ncbi:MAG: hypothetical protein ACQGVK_06140 [Myxococcota bacterium]
MKHSRTLPGFRPWTRRRGVGAVVGVVALAGALGLAGPRPAAARSAGEADRPWEANGAPIAMEGDGPVFRVTGFELRYGRDNPAHPPLSKLRAIEVDLGWTLEGFVAPRDGVPVESIRLGEVEGGAKQLFYGSAIRTINESVFAFFNERDIQGVVVVPDPEDIEPRSNRDLRPPGRTTLRLIVWTGQLEELRTFASGERIPEAERIDNPAHARIKEFSPVQPGGENSLLRKDLLDDYVHRLNRHPGRNVDIALSAANQPGGVYLDYLVAENKPWSVYAQASNTGTDATTEWRERFGFIHNQLTGHDDIFNLDYVTGNFQDVHAVFGGYEAPLYRTPKVRLGAEGAWSQFDASEVGSNEDFSGYQWNFAGRATANVFQWQDLFVDFEAIGHFYRVQVDEDNQKNGNEDFVTVEPALRLEWFGQTRRVYARASSETSLPHLFGTDFDGQRRDSLGRRKTSDSFTALRAELSLSTFLEPLLFPRAWQDPSTPSSSTLAHEVAFDGHAQLALDKKRLVPQFEAVAGGLYTVRGYDQSVSAGDDSAIFSVEYRLHIPQLLGIDPTPLQVPVVGPFKYRAQQVYDQPDWDLIFRPFFDFGYISTNRPRSDERSSDMLLGVGAGLELSIKRNLVVSFDWGHALREVNPDQELEQGTKSGNNEFHFSATITY